MYRTAMHWFLRHVTKISNCRFLFSRITCIPIITFCMCCVCSLPCMVAHVSYLVKEIMHYLWCTIESTTCIWSKWSQNISQFTILVIQSAPKSVVNWRQTKQWTTAMAADVKVEACHHGLKVPTENWCKPIFYQWNL